MACSILCQACGVEAPTRYVEFHQNIGALLMRFHRSVKGNLCKRCIHREYWKKTGTTASVGWFGTISLIVTPIFVVTNTVYYLKSAAMPKTPADAQVPQLTHEAVTAINPLAGELMSRLNQQEPIDMVAMDIASRTGATPGQVVLFLRAMAQHRQVSQARVQGFPVIPVRARPVENLDPIPLDDPQA